MHATLALEPGDQGVDGAGGERVAADQERMEAEDGAQPVILDEFRDEAVDAAPAAEADEVGGDAGHVGPVQERHVAELLEADAVDLLAGGHEAVVASDVVGREAGDLGAHGVGVAAVVEGGAVVEADAVERVDRAEFDVVGEGAAAQRPEFFEEDRRGDDGGAGVEGEAVLAEDGGAAAGFGEALEDGDAVAAGAEPDGGGEPAEAAADDDGMRGEVGAQRYGCQRVH